jgi:aldehyde dehydrogenase (NAD+)
MQPQTLVTQVLNRIGDRWAPARDGRTLQVRDPADLEQVVAVSPCSPREDAAAAVAAAAEAYPGWSRLAPARRADLLGGALGALRRRRDELAVIITRENGKTLAESLAEVDAAAREMEWQIGEGRRLGGEVMPSDRPEVLAYVLRRPLGVVSAILPFNFPFNVPVRKCVPALMAGNTVVMKPSSLTPRSGAAFVELLLEAGLPPGVINAVTGDGDSVGDELVRNPLVKAVSFTGSTPVGMGIHRAAAETLARTQLEMGGKNAAVVLADADLGLAADAVVSAAFACAGQWCTSTSRALVERPVYEAFAAAVLERVGRLRVGPGMAAGTTMGPVCGEARLRAVLAHISRAREDGARLLCGGERIGNRGCFIGPTVFGEVHPGMRLAREEVFGPVLALMPVDGFDQAVAIANDIEYGLSSSVFTASLDRALAFAERTEVGLAHVNLSTAHKEPQLPFGGVKRSGCGLPEAGSSGIEFFTRHQVVYVGRSTRV